MKGSNTHKRHTAKSQNRVQNNEHYTKHYLQSSWKRV